MRAVALSLLSLLMLLLSTPPTPAAAETAGAAQSHVLVVLVFDETCKVWCERVRPIMKDLGHELGPEVKVAELDATASVLKETTQTAKDLGVLGVFKDVMDYVPVVLIFNRKGKLVKELTGPKSRDVYREQIQKALNSR